MKQVQLLLMCLLVGGSACVSVIKPDLETRQSARLASSNGDWDQAMGLWDHVLNHHRGKDFEARMGLAEALLHSERGLGAIQVLRAAEPDSDQGLQYGLLLARAHFSQGQVRPGSQVLSGLLVDHASNVELLTLYGKGLLGSDRESKGLGLLLQALRIDAGDGVLAEDVAQRARALELPDMEGEAWTLRLGGPQPPVEAHVGAAAWDLARAEKEGVTPGPETKEILQRAVELDPLNGRAWTLIGDLARALGEDLEARQAYRSAVEVDPGNHYACLALARMYVDLGECAEAKIWIDQGLAANLKEPQREPFLELQASCD